MRYQAPLHRTLTRTRTALIERNNGRRPDRHGGGGKTLTGAETIHLDGRMPVDAASVLHLRR